MQVKICTHGIIVNDAIRSQMGRRLRAALASRSIPAARAIVTLTGETGKPKHCSITLKLGQAGSVLAQAQDTQLTQAMSKAVERITPPLRRAMARIKARARRLAITSIASAEQLAASNHCANIDQSRHTLRRSTA
jgi:ribosome-associated translation inhibitor RaiA